MKRLSVLALLAVLLIACGSPPAEIEDGTALPADIGAATLATGSARTFSHQTMTFDESAGGGKLIMKAVGMISFEDQLQSMTMTSEGEGQGGLAASQIGTMEMVGEGLVLYIKSSMFQQLPGVKPWVKMDMQALGEEMGMDLDSLMQMNQGDAAASLDYLEGLEDVEVVGEEAVHGKTTTHYRGRGTFDKMKELVPDDAVETIEKLQEIMGIEDYEVEVWIDTQNRARRMKLRYDALPMPGTEGKWEMLMEFYDFGVDVEVELPPPHKVTDILEITGGAALDS